MSAQPDDSSVMPEKGQRIKVTWSENKKRIGKEGVITSNPMPIGMNRPGWTAFVKADNSETFLLNSTNDDWDVIG
jgi:hypothetical protein